MAHDKSRFRVTAWPGALPHPVQLYVSDVEVDRGLLRDVSDYRLPFDVGEHPTHEELVDALIADGMRPPSDRYDEIYLQLFTLDLDSEPAIASWASEFGMFQPHAQSIGHDPDLPIAHPYPHLRHYPLFSRDDRPYEAQHQWWVELVEQESDEIRAMAGFSNERLQREKMLKPVTVEEFRWAVRCIRDLARAYWCLSTVATPLSMVWENPLVVDALEKFGAETWWDEEAMHEFLSETLRDALQNYSPQLLAPEYLSARGDDRAAGFHNAVNYGHSIRDSGGLFAVCCIELFNHIAEGEVYKTCANERCGRWFVRQQGRSAHNQRRRTGVKFCSYACSRASTQRAYNQRKREQRAG